MRYFDICRILANYLYGFSCLFFIPLGISIYYQKFHPEGNLYPHITSAFYKSMCVSFALATLFYWAGKKSEGKLYHKEGVFLVVIIWFITGFVAGLPFYLSKTLKKPIDAYFEAISGLTTTGASMMTPKEWDPETGKETLITKEAESLFHRKYEFYGTLEPIKDPETGTILYEGIEAVAPPLLFWRSFLQWLGGMGIVVLFVAILPLLGIGGKVLYRSEVPGPLKEGLTPRVKETAIMLWKIYSFFTLSEIFLLMITNSKLSLLSAMTITFSTLSTGGFTITNGNIASYNNVMTEWITMLFMVLGGINFTIYFYCVHRKWRSLLNGELLIYLAMLCIGSGIISWQIIGEKKSILSGEVGTFSFTEAFHYGFYHYISAQTSTGFSTVNYDLWPPLAQFLMWIGMFIGSMAGSTGGGMKIIRHYILFKVIFNQIHSLFRPRQIYSCKIGGQNISQTTILYIFSFFVLTIVLSVVGTLFFLCSGIDMETAFGLNACMLNNIGMAFCSAGPSDTFAFLPFSAKCLSILWMILGRLEYFALLIVLLPSFWKKQ